MLPKISEVDDNEDVIDEGSEYGDENIPLRRIEETDWNADAKELNLDSRAELIKAKKWIDQEKKEMKEDNNPLSTDQTFDVSKLNTKQMRAYDYVVNWIEQKKTDPSHSSLYLNLSGRAGCGKSTWLNTLAQYIKENVEAKNFMKIAAPTANAAFLVKGSTIHALLRIPPKVSLSKDLPELRGQALVELQEDFKEVELIVIDEKSMVGLHMLYMMHKRLTEIKCCKKPFGGVSLILMGDFAQLPPVKDQPLYNKDVEKLQDFQVQGKNLFQHFGDKGNTIIFDEIMRQQGESQKRFKECLNNLADGSFDQQDWLYLKERDLFLGNFSTEERKEIMSSATMITSTNKAAKEYNIKRIKDIGTTIFPVRSENNCKEAANASFNKSGLMNQILLAKDCDVLITSNLWKSVGLTNGARGKVKYIIYEKGVKPPSLPAVVIVQVDQYTGPPFMGLEKCVPIVPVTRQWYEGGQPCSRTMLPLNLAYATTIHKSQGMSLSKVIINIGNREFASGLTYTAISRCRKVEELFFLPYYNFVRFRSIRTSKIFKARKRQEEREVKSDKQFL